MNFSKNAKRTIISVLVAIILFFTTSKTVFANNNEKYVYLGGNSFGLKMHTNGVIVVKLESFYNGNKYICPAKEGGLKECDIIKKINNIAINSSEELSSYILNNNNSELDFLIERNGKTLNKKVKPEKNMSGNFLIGAWTRDSSAGIGTVTFYDDDEKYFAALGHGICDADTSTLMPLASGEAVKAKIIGVDKSTKGNAGSLNGYFTNEVIGAINENTSLGIYGSYNDEIIDNKEKIAVAKAQEVKTGDALLYTTIDGENPQSYTVEIVRINSGFRANGSDFTIKITDEKLIEKTGGIVQGMSGSPIVQNQKLVGAVTHVFISQPEEGYGIFAETMLKFNK